MTRREIRKISIIYAVPLVIWGLLWTYDWWEGHDFLGETAWVTIPRLAAFAILTASGCLFVVFLCFWDYPFTRISAHHLRWTIGGGISFAGLQILFQAWNKGEPVTVLYFAVAAVSMGCIYGMAALIVVWTNVVVNRWFVGADDEGEP